MHHKQTGFSPVIVLLLLVVLCAAVGSGFLVWHKKQASTLPYPVTYIKPEGTAVYEDSMVANLRILGTHSVNNGFGIELQAKILKIFSYQRIEGVSYPMIHEGQQLNMSLYSSTNIGGNWKALCGNAPDAFSPTLPCSGGQLSFAALQPPQVASFIDSNKNKAVKAEVGCGASSTCSASIDGLAK